MIVTIRIDGWQTPCCGECFRAGVVVEWPVAEVDIENHAGAGRGAERPDARLGAGAGRAVAPGHGG
ncbi:hypothetical protein CLM83_27345 [Streptomyces albidoflavus]|uniref:DUF6578 domain-containing protein n=1 Tax=Streptomyces albidoflavus TaxID=1886 RepID=UPI000BB660F3|nr:DUF6578 domain-containing protein [Streptomyces albidoflavus]PBO15860.1 hypothetical protein CLM83_27345 [Streptomyces albidoflavus]